MNDLGFLSKEESIKILEVVKRDEALCGQDQLLFDEIKTEIKQLQAEVQTHQQLERLCEVCRKTAVRDKARICKFCQKKTCAMCTKTLTKSKQKNTVNMCIVCSKERTLLQMSGAWVLNFKRNKVQKDEDKKEEEGQIPQHELQMSAIKRVYDGVHGLSPSGEIIKSLLVKIEQPQKKLKTEEVEEDITLVQLANEKHFPQNNVIKEEDGTTFKEYEETEEAIDDRNMHQDKKEYNGFKILAEVYSFDDFSESTKEKAYQDQNEIDELKICQKSDCDDVDKTHSMDESEVPVSHDNNYNVVKTTSQCPVHSSEICINEDTVDDYDIIKTPTPKRKVEGLEKIAIPNSNTWDNDGNNSSYDEIDKTDINILTSGVVSENGNTIKLVTNEEKPTIYIPSRQEDDDYDEGYANYSYTSSLDLSLHGSYINSYYGD